VTAQIFCRLELDEFADARAVSAEVVEISVQAFLGDGFRSSAGIFNITEMFVKTKREIP
jgi:hypothetical protein